MLIDFYNIGIRNIISMTFTCIVSLHVLFGSLKQETVQDPITQIIIIGRKNNNNQLKLQVDTYEN